MEYVSGTGTIGNPYIITNNNIKENKEIAIEKVKELKKNIEGGEKVEER